ncbi:hypothetical protein O59_001058 [Cellvibrio sp. BR]|uniref:GAD-like domain-containing protein n=1 Tax=Cellvibrio sp. BR TaxID=1134474 RepID=UPI0002600CC8|nr:GAD-like domain-containing protein [Cellvibrio sp. BR]EIK47037.1 hypothetical protein O59_001058 [Cellvibrio sp. BR]
MRITENKKFEWFLKKFGSPIHSQIATQETIEKYRNRLPDALIDCWTEYGFCSFLDGLFQIVNPEIYRETIPTWLKGTGLLEIDTFHVFARSGFGELFLWGEKTGQHFNIEILEGSIFDNGSDENYINKEGSSEAILNFFTVLKPSSLDIEDINTEEPIFQYAIDRLGALADDEMFTFEPAPFLGGEQTFKAVNKVNFFIQNEILASMGQREIMDIKCLANKAFGK